MLRFAFGAASHVGLVRETNEDAAFAGPYLQVVADGVGGAAAGEVASATTTYVVSALAAARPDDDPAVLLVDAVRLAHAELRRGIADDATRTGMATTLIAALIRRDQVTLVHVGDSRAYLLRDGELSRLSSDHTFVQSLVDAGRLTPEEAARHPYRSVVLRSVNADDEPGPVVMDPDLRLGDRLLLCSDGLTDFVPDETLAGLLGEPDPDDAAVRLVEAALATGGRDNVTCLVADLVDGPPVRGDGRVLGAMADPRLVVDPAAVRAGTDSP
ncbi:MAG TPA: protein phosphatase 2C domain-containing protein [Nocardioides sp.]|nr:protein phosphatase 2C domain-containing protein [Nocardioides sp.]